MLLYNKICRKKRMVVAYYINFFRTVTDRHNGILMSLLPRAEETIITGCKISYTTRNIKINIIVFFMKIHFWQMTLLTVLSFLLTVLKEAFKGSIFIAKFSKNVRAINRFILLLIWGLLLIWNNRLWKN